MPARTGKSPAFHRETLWFATAPPIDYIHFTSSKESSHEHSEGIGKVLQSRCRVSIEAPICSAETSAAHSTMRGGSDDTRRLDNQNTVMAPHPCRCPKARRIENMQDLAMDVLRFLFDSHPDYLVGGLILLVLHKAPRRFERVVGVDHDRTKTFADAVASQFPRFRCATGFLDSRQEKTYSANSPVALTGKGNRLAKKLNAKDTVMTMLPNVMKLLPKDPSLMDVQKVCFNYALTGLLKDADRDLRHKIDRQVYLDMGNYDNTLMVYGILFRDAVFESPDFTGRP